MIGPRFRPSGSAIAVAIGLIWALSFGAARDFVWADLRTGMMTTAGLARATRVIIWAGFGLVFALIGALLFNDTWRAELPLVSIHNSTGLGLAGRGGQLPNLLVPATLALIAVGWGFILTGALHCHIGIRLLALVFYLDSAAIWAFSGQSGLSPSWPALAAGVVGFVGVPALFVARWRAPPRPVPELLALLVAIALAYVPGHAQSVASMRMSGAPGTFVQLQASVGQLQFLVLPMLILLGMDVANFTRHASGWVVTVVVERLPRWMPHAILAAALAWRVVELLPEVTVNVERDLPDTGILAYAGALAEVVAVLVIGWIVLRARREGTPGPPSAEDVASSVAPVVLPIILVFSLVPVFVLAFVAVDGLFALASLVSIARLGDPVYDRVIDTIGWLGRAVPVMSSDETFFVWHILLAALALVGAVWLTRRGRVALALYLGIFGALHILWRLTRPGQPFESFHWEGWEAIDPWWVAVLALVSVMWLVRRSLTADRAARLLFLLLITFLLRQTDFIENPFSPFFAFAGIGFLAFGIVWDALTRGSWANDDSPALPRTGRIFLYLGYTLLTATLVNFVLTSHNLAYLELFTGGGALVGLESIGRPFLYALFVVTLALPSLATPDTPEPYRAPV